MLKLLTVIGLICSFNFNAKAASLVIGTSGPMSITSINMNHDFDVPYLRVTSIDQACEISKEVAAKSGYTLGELQNLVSQDGSNVRLICNFGHDGAKPDQVSVKISKVK